MKNELKSFLKDNLKGTKKYGISFVFLHARVIFTSEVTFSTPSIEYRFNV